ncbi:DUF2935 domain-containing protein [Clostridiaceae bacterium 35-E11]
MFDIAREVEFWTEIMRDHGKFQHDALAPQESESIKMTKYFINLFHRLHVEANEFPTNASSIEINNFVNKNTSALTHFIQFKTFLLRRLMKCNIHLGLPPSFINHMLNEAMEYYRVLCFIQGSIPFDQPLENLRLHRIWLPDASGHASAIASDLDAVESELIQCAQEFAKRFDNLVKKTSELSKIYERTGFKDSSLTYLNKEVAEEIDKFVCYLEKIKALRSKCSILGTISPLLPDHMIREEKYYMYRIEQLHD